ncbi:MAG: hypothetical protein IRY96_11010 [Burkholderiales bacterium]|nr:hypothetical protein [Burkholderiales bacterium]
MNEYTLARALHVLGVVIWIGGVAMVTTVLLPAVRAFKSPEERVEFFERVEARFASQARWTTALVGLTGFWLAWRFDLWWRFADPAYWWMHAMVAVWAIFTLMLFVLEPLFLHRWFLERARHDPAGTFALVQKLHWFLLAVSLVTVLGAVAGSHGGLLTP